MKRVLYSVARFVLTLEFKSIAICCYTYNFLLDAFGIRIGSFRIATFVASGALICLFDCLRNGHAPFNIGFFIGTMLTGTYALYSSALADIENSLQKSGQLIFLNMNAIAVYCKFTGIRFFYLLFTLSTLLYPGFWISPILAYYVILVARSIPIRARKKDRFKWPERESSAIPEPA